ncbi:MAG: AzlC family ABC transporter permease [Limnochordia bacterium]|jgi:4-azaleucine resistance transporter AzlC|nr:AzlC family ABC transporter permease [Bacillota bacterium]
MGKNESGFVYGLKRGIPITMGYIPVGFTFGLMVASSGLPPWIAVFTSLTNLTSAGQFAGIRILLAGAGYLEIMLTTLVINLRYVLMSLSLTQKVDQGMALGQRLAISFGITDETFAVASVENGRLSFSYLSGLMIGPFLAWSGGTALGGLVSTALPPQLGSAMGIALYAMFIALIIPPAVQSHRIFGVIAISVGISVVLRYVPVFSFVSAGFRIIAAALVGAGLSAWLWPDREEQ